MDVSNGAPCVFAYLKVLTEFGFQSDLVCDEITLLRKYCGGCDDHNHNLRGSRGTYNESGGISSFVPQLLAFHQSEASKSVGL